MPDLLKVLVLAILVAARFTLNLCDGSSFDQRVFEGDVGHPDTARDSDASSSLEPRMKEFLVEFYLDELRRKHEDDSPTIGITFNCLQSNY